MNFFGPFKTVLWDYFLKPILNAFTGTMGEQIGKQVGETVGKRVAEIIEPLTAAELTLPAVVPHGLRSFDEEDASFFLNLLPGPYREDGLPESIHFWKTRIDETDADKTFSVGLIYGPSGCGKSSLMKAGLIPLLADHVTTVYVEATPTDTEKRILVALQKHCPQLEPKSSIRAALRRKEKIPKGKKVLLILDQFEQYLHATSADDQKNLADALRECDGEQLQCVVMVREDFITPVTVFINRLDIRLSQNENYALVNLFDKRHAKKVLALFGQSFGSLPKPGPFSKEQDTFLNQAISGLAEGDYVICVRLALFAQMVKAKDWTPTTLKGLGGTEGVGKAFLEESFDAKSAPLENRRHADAAREILNALLPETGTDIKGEMKSYDELLEASGYGRPSNMDFDDLLQILDNNLRLITPTDPAGVIGDDGSVSQSEAGQKYYQLTHDYLVPSLRDWLTSEQEKTRKGRAKLLLAKRTSLWTANSESRHLPAVWEWANIRALTDKKKWTEPQRKMMGKAGRIHCFRATTVAIVLILLSWAGYEFNGRVKAESIVRSITSDEAETLKRHVEEMAPYERWATPLLKEIVISEDSTSKAKLHASLVLVKDDPSHVGFLFQRLLSAKTDDVSVIVTFLKPHEGQLDRQLWDAIENGSNSERIRAAAAQAEYNAKNEQWEQVCEDVVTALVSVPVLESKNWIEMLRPVGSVLADPLEQRFQDRSSERDAERPITAAALADYLRDDSQSLKELILLAGNDREFQPFLLAIRNHRQSVVPDLQALLVQSPLAESTPDERVAFWKKQANAAVCLLELEEKDSFWPLFKQTQDSSPLKQTQDLSLRSVIIDRLALLGADPATLSRQIKQESDPSSRYALLLALGHFDLGKMSSQQKQGLVDQLAFLYRDNPDPGVHSAAGWALQNWRQNQIVTEIDTELKNSPAKQDRNWFVNSQGQTYIVVTAPVEFLMGEETTAKKVTLFHSFAMASHEVTVAQFQKFRSDQKLDTKSSPEPNCPMNAVSWFDAVAYCNWLSEQEGIPQDQWCYEKNDKGKYSDGMKIPANYLERSGYRLPTGEEWEFVCRANSTSSYGYGESEDLLTRYAWYNDNSKSRMWPVGEKLPNGLGGFDMHGNANEWCHNLSSAPQGHLDEVVNGRNGRLLRGGSFDYQSSFVRSAGRFNVQPADRAYLIGFRPARTYHLFP